MDLIMGGFAAAKLAEFDEAMLERFEALMELPEPEVFAWVTGQESVPDDADQALIAAIAAHARETRR